MTFRGDTVARMELTDRRMLTTTDGLSAHEVAQLGEIGRLYFGSVGPVTIDDDFPGDPLASRVLMCVDRWKVVENGTHAYDLWQYMSDSGTMFRAGTSEIVAEIIQEGVECDDSAIADALDNAIAQSRKKPTKPAAKKPTKPAAKKPTKPAAKKPTKTTAKKPAARKRT
jgi:hypothetical protein